MNTCTVAADSARFDIMRISAGILVPAARWYIFFPPRVAELLHYDTYWQGVQVLRTIRHRDIDCSTLHPPTLQ